MSALILVRVLLILQFFISIRSKQWKLILNDIWYLEYLISLVFESNLKQL
jgi:hypothetical protein